MGDISQSARTPYGFILVRNRLKRLKELVYRSGGSLESSLREDFRLSVRFCPNSPFAPFMSVAAQIITFAFYGNRITLIPLLLRMTLIDFQPGVTTSISP